MSVKFKKLREGFELPTKAHDSDACFDVKVLHIEQQENLMICYLGFSTEIPFGYKGVIVPRSSITKTKWAMLNSPGQIDSGYRAEWQVRFSYVGQVNSVFSKFPFEIGDRVAQIYFEQVSEMELELVDELIDSQRGQGGFGSTGK